MRAELGLLLSFAAAPAWAGCVDLQPTGLLFEKGPLAVVTALIVL